MLPQWWLDWIIDETQSDSGFWIQDRLSWLLATFASEKTRNSFLVEFNKPDSKYRSVLAQAILRRHNSISTDDFSPDAISFLLGNLGRTQKVVILGDHLLGRAATEQFVTERLLPLLPAADGTLLTNLQTVLRQAGRRHGRRYFSECHLQFEDKGSPAGNEHPTEIKEAAKTVILGNTSPAEDPL